MPRYFSAISSHAAERLVGRVAPELLAHALMQALGEGLGQPVGQRLDHDRRVVVVRALEALGHLVLADAGGDREAADIVGEPARARRDEIGERHVGAAFAPRELLAQRVQHGHRRRARLVGIDTGCRRRRHWPARSRSPRSARNQRSATIRSSIACASSIEAARGRPVLGVVEDGGKLAGQLPGGEERRPVDVVDQLGDRIVVEHPGAEEARPRRQRSCPTSRA